MNINKIGFQNYHKKIGFGQKNYYRNYGSYNNENWEEDSLHDRLRDHILLRAGGTAYQLMTHQPHSINAENLRKEELDKLTFDYDYLKSLNIPNFTILTNRKGVRGICLLEGKYTKYLPLIKKAGIKQIIDLRDNKPETSDEKNRNLCNQNGLEYFHFPISYENNFSEQNYKLLPKLNELMENGRFYIACNEGINRTDLAIAFNFLLSPKQKVTPKLKSYAPISAIYIVEKEINKNILNNETPTPPREDIENYIKSLGWSDFNTFKDNYKHKLASLNGSNRN